MENKKIPSAYLDEKVILTLIIVSLAALLFTAFKYSNYKPCGGFQLRTQAESYRTGDPIRFETNARTNEYHWDFGDNESDQTNIASVVHAYNEPGEYTIALTINDNCTEYKTLYITRAPKIVNPVLLPTFVCPQTAEVGKPVDFDDTTNGARSWEWRFGETATVDATSQSATYTYKTPGLKTITLVINGDLQQIGTCKIYVNPPPARKPSGGGQGPSPIIIVPAKPNSPTLDDQRESGETTPSKPQGQAISKQDLEAMLRKVVNDLAKAEDFAPYICNNMNMPVSLDGKEITFRELCTKLSAIKGEKKIKELSVQQIKNNETGCILSLNVHLRMRKGILGIFK